MDRLVDLLIEKKPLTAKFRQIVAEYTDVPESSSTLRLCKGVKASRLTRYTKKT